MPRIQPVAKETTDSATAELLGMVEKKMHKAPNIVKTMATSLAVAKAYLGMSQSLSGGKLPARLREQIALVVAEMNNCTYCLAAHTVLGKSAGLTEAETRDARRATSRNEKERSALDFARRLVQDRGVVTDADVERVFQAGYTDGELAEIVANVALNIFANYFNHVAGTELDFPVAPELAAT